MNLDERITYTRRHLDEMLERAREQGREEVRNKLDAKTIAKPVEVNAIVPAATVACPQCSARLCQGPWDGVICGRCHWWGWRS